jgi:hypothetical protein
VTQGGVIFSSPGSSLGTPSGMLRPGQTSPSNDMRFANHILTEFHRLLRLFHYLIRLV